MKVSTEGVSEFKYKTARVYSFDDGRRVVLTHGRDGKHLDRAVEQRKIAKRVWAEYIEWKERK